MRIIPDPSDSLTGTQQLAELSPGGKRPHAKSALDFEDCLKRLERLLKNYSSAN
jgi:hypothetical protein